MNAVAGRLAEA